MSSSSRSLVLAVATALLLIAGLFAPAAAQPAPDRPPTVADRLEGLPAARPGARMSRPVATPIPFSMVGFKVPRGADLEFRTSVDGRNWGVWTHAEVEPDEGPDATSAEGRAAQPQMSAPVWVGEAAHLQTRLKGGDRSARPENTEVHLIDSSGLGRGWAGRMADRFSAAWRGTPQTAHAMPARPDIITRSQWGANESIRRGAPSYSRKIVMGFVHHTVNSNGYTREQSDDLVRGIYSYHVHSNGWSDIGYNFLVDRFGRIYEGRYGGVAKSVIGAHAGGFNTATFGVSLIGTFDSQRLSKPMRRGLRRLLAWKYDVHHVNVLGKTNYTSHGSTRYPAGQTVRMHRLAGHRDASTTACPGAKAYELLPALRRSVAASQGAVILHPAVSPRRIEVVGGQSVSGAVNFKARLRPAGPWTVRVTNRDGILVHTMSGSAEYMSHDWLPVGVQPGKYRYTITSPDRRGVRGTLRVTRPVLSGSVTPTTVTYGLDGVARTPLTFTGDLYDNAEWRLQVFDPDRVRVLRRDGTGDTMSETWLATFAQPGRYSWRLTAPDALAASGTFRVYADHVTRAARAVAAPAAAAHISRRTFAAGTAQRAVLATTATPGYALAGAGLAGKDGPLLYTFAESLPASTLKELHRSLRPDAPVFVLGDTSVVSSSVTAQLETEFGATRVRRVNGSRTPTVAAEVSRLVVARTGATSAVVVGTGAAGSWRQSVTAGAYAAAAGVPVLITKRDVLSPAAAGAIARDGIVTTTIIGNTDSVSASVESQLPAAVRVAGDSPAQTAVAVAQKLLLRTTATSGDSYVFVNAARSDGWVRPVAAAPLAARTGAVVLLADANSLPRATTDYLGALNYTRLALGRGTVLGDAEHIGSTVETTLERLLQ